MAAEMPQKDLEAFKHFLGAYKHQKDLNRYFYDQYNEDIEYYLGRVPSTRYPLPYNMSFNRLLPKIMTAVSKWISQLYQPASHNFVSVRARKARDLNRRERIEGLLNTQIERLNDVDWAGGGFRMFREWMTDAAAWGTGIVKEYWRKEERIGPVRRPVVIPVIRNGMLVDLQMQEVVTEAPQIVYDGPYVENRPVKCFVPHPHYKNIQQMPFVFDVYRRSVDYLRRMQSRGKFRNIDKIGGWSSYKSADARDRESQHSAEAYASQLMLEGAEVPGDFETQRLAPEVDVIEGYGKYIFPEDDAPYEVGSGYKIKGKESEAIVHMANYNTLLSVQKNRYGLKPYHAISCYPSPELFWGIGLICLGKNIQEQINVLANTRFTNAVMLVNQMLKVQMDSDVDPAALIPKPGGIIPVDNMDDVEPLIQPDVTQTGVFREQEQFFDDTISDMLGIYPYNMGRTPERQEHVGTIYSLQSMGEQRMRLILMMMDYQGFQPLLRHMMLLNLWHLPPGFEARIVGQRGDRFEPLLVGDLRNLDFDFTMRYTSMEPSLGKQFRLQQLLQWAQIWNEMPFLQHAEIAKAMLEMMDFHEQERFIKSEQQMAAEQQQAMQSQVAQAQFQANLQNQLAAANDEREMVKETTKALLKG